MILSCSNSSLSRVSWAVLHSRREGGWDTGMGIGVLSPHTRSWNHGMLWVGRHHKDNLIPPQAPSNVFHSFVLSWFGDFCFVLGLEQRISDGEKTNPSVSQISSFSIPVQIAGVPGCGPPHFESNSMVQAQESVRQLWRQAGFFRDRGIGWNPVSATCCLQYRL